MPVSSLSQRIKQIIDLAHGNRAQAERIIREQIDRDPQFLRQLVDPYLRGIIAHALSQGPVAVEAKPPVKPLSDDGMTALLRGLQSQSTAAPTGRPAGQGHADAMRAIAAAHKKK